MICGGLAAASSSSNLPGMVELLRRPPRFRPGGMWRRSKTGFGGNRRGLFEIAASASLACPASDSAQAQPYRAAANCGDIRIGGDKPRIQLDRLRRLMQLVVQPGGGQQRVGELRALRILVERSTGTTPGQRRIFSTAPATCPRAQAASAANSPSGNFSNSRVECCRGFFRLVQVELAPTQAAQTAYDVFRRISVGRERCEQFAGPLGVAGGQARLRRVDAWSRATDRSVCWTAVCAAPGGARRLRWSYFCLAASSCLQRA